ncbi:energy transducer TonB [Neisseria sp.]|uniref:energy transducer TonB n=1 Tax=Neisseria sp. TaxID=192066 RepID=UPI0035A173A8
MKKIVNVAAAAVLLAAAMPSVAAESRNAVSEGGKIRAVYPIEAQKSGIEGVVGLEILVSPQNRVHKVTVTRSSGSPILDEAAVKAVHEASFRVTDWTRIKTQVEFKLRG